MRKRHAILGCIIFAIYYALVCVLLHAGLLKDSAEPENIIVDAVIIPRKCDCENDWSKQTHMAEAVDLQSSLLHTDWSKTMCLASGIVDHEADIQMYNVTLDMKIDYPAFIWTHNGWIQKMYATYDEHRWDSNPLVVHVVPFSHHDPGWLSSYDTYFTSWTKPCLDVILRQLSSNINMTFVWPEVLFLQRWYNQLNDKQMKDFQQIISSGQFEIVTGGWVMTDETVAHYEAMIDQLVEGHSWLQQELDFKPGSAWSIDPFGHSPTMAYILQQSAIKSMFIQRAHYAIKKHLAFRRQLEFTWEQSWEVEAVEGDKSPDSTGNSILCHLAPYMLSSTVYSCGPDINTCCKFDFTRSKCWQQGAYRDPTGVTTENINDLASELVDQLRQKAHFFHHNHVMFTVGDDFRFTDHVEWEKQFKNLTMLMNYINQDPRWNVQMQYSNLSAYMNAVQDYKSSKQSQPKIPSLHGDFLMYSDRSDQYWTGFFTSRPLLKSLIRLIHTRLRAAEIFYTLVTTNEKRFSAVQTKFNATVANCQKELNEMRQLNALLHHHDAITGTARADVVKSYLENIHSSLDRWRELISQLVNVKLADSFSQKEVLYTVMDEQPSATALPHMPVIGNATELIFFNPLAQHRTEVVTIPTSFVHAVVSDGNQYVPCQSSPITDRSSFFIADKYTVSFEVSVPALGMARYHVKPASGNTQPSCRLALVSVYSGQHHHGIRSAFHISWHSSMSPISISNSRLTAKFCQCTRLLQGVIQRPNVTLYKAQMSFITYGTGKLFNPFADKSGAYLFLPDGPAKTLKHDSPTAIVIEGDVVSSVTTYVSHTASQTISLFNTTGTQGDGVHVINDVCLKHPADRNNTELAMKLTTSINSGNDLFVDINGFQIQRHTVQKRIPIQGNYRPMTTAAYLQDDSSRITLLSADSHGVASLESGCLEVMLERRLQQDDWRGLGEGISDNVHVSSRFILLFEKVLPQPAIKRSIVGLLSLVGLQLSRQLNNPLVPLNRNLRSIADPMSATDVLFRPMQQELPCDVHVINMRSGFTLSNVNSFLLILHRQGYDCNIAVANPSKLCKPIESYSTINLRDLFVSMKITAIERTSLTGTTALTSVTNSNVHLPAMHIRTWKLYAI